MGKNCLLNISEVKGLKYTPNNLFFTNVPDKKSTKVFLSYIMTIPDGSFNIVRSKKKSFACCLVPKYLSITKAVDRVLMCAHMETCQPSL